MMKSYGYIFFFLLLSLVMAGCRTQQRAERRRQSLLEQQQMRGMADLIGDENSGNASSSSPHDMVRKRNTEVSSLQANLDMTLRSGNKSISIGGTFRARRGDVVQLNLVYTVLVLPVNVGTIELTQEGILLVDRISKRYCRARYDEVSELRKYGVDFNYFQDMFWGDAQDLYAPLFCCSYDSWENLSQGRFPVGMTFHIRSQKHSASAVMQLSNLRETDRWELRTQIGSKYTQVSMDEVMQAILNVAR